MFFFATIIISDLSNLKRTRLTELCGGVLLDVVGEEHEVVGGQVQTNRHDGRASVQAAKLVPQFYKEKYINLRNLYLKIHKIIEKHDETLCPANNLVLVKEPIKKIFILNIFPKNN